MVNILPIKEAQTMPETPNSLVKYIAKGIKKANLKQTIIKPNLSFPRPLINEPYAAEKQDQPMSKKNASDSKKGILIVSPIQISKIKSLNSN